MTVAILSGNGSGPFVSPMGDAKAHGATFSFVVQYMYNIYIVYVIFIFFFFVEEKERGDAF